MINALADSGFIYSAFDVDDEDHPKCVQMFRIRSQRVCLPTVTLSEVAFLIERNIYHAQIPVTFRAMRQSRMTWIHPEFEDYDRAADIMEKYRDAELDLVDSVITAMAERMNIQRILMLDRRDFGMIRPKHCPAFEILP